jgi:hypothetical protein
MPTKIKDSILTISAQGKLTRAGVETLEQAFAMSDADLMGLVGIGDATVRELRDIEKTMEKDRRGNSLEIIEGERRPPVRHPRRPATAHESVTFARQAAVELRTRLAAARAVADPVAAQVLLPLLEASAGLEQKLSALELAMETSK